MRLRRTITKRPLGLRRVHLHSPRPCADSSAVVCGCAKYALAGPLPRAGCFYRFFNLLRRGGGGKVLSATDRCAVLSFQPAHNSVPARFHIYLLYDTTAHTQQHKHQYGNKHYTHKFLGIPFFGFPPSFSFLFRMHNAPSSTIVVEFLGFSTSKVRDTSNAPKDPALSDGF